MYSISVTYIWHNGQNNFWNDQIGREMAMEGKANSCTVSVLCTNIIY